MNLHQLINLSFKGIRTGGFSEKPLVTLQKSVNAEVEEPVDEEPETETDETDDTPVEQPGLLE